MKQHITEEQLKELNKKGGEYLDIWWRRNYYMGEIPGSIDTDEYYSGLYHDPLLSIGQMIEFLDEHNRFILTVEALHGNGAKNFCDALWEAVKEVLQKK